MDTFAVINIEQCYEDIEDVECLGSFITEESAQDFAKEKEQEQYEIRDRRWVYEEGFLNSMEIPDLNRQDWSLYIESLGLNRMTTKETFKRELNFLMRRSNPKIEGFDPPPKERRLQLHVVKVPNP